MSTTDHVLREQRDGAAKTMHEHFRTWPRVGPPLDPDKMPRATGGIDIQLKHPPCPLRALVRQAHSVAGIVADMHAVHSRLKGEAQILSDLASDVGDRELPRAAEPPQHGIDTVAYPIGGVEYHVAPAVADELNRLHRGVTGAVTLVADAIALRNAARSLGESMLREALRDMARIAVAAEPAKRLPVFEDVAHERIAAFLSTTNPTNPCKGGV